MLGHQVSNVAGESGPLETSSSRKTMRSDNIEGANACIHWLYSYRIVISTYNIGL